MFTTKENFEAKCRFTRSSSDGNETKKSLIAQHAMCVVTGCLDGAFIVITITEEIDQDTLSGRKLYDTEEVEDDEWSYCEIYGTEEENDEF